MKIENYEGTLDTFTFPYNPLTFDTALDANLTKTELPYYRHHYFVSGGGISPSTLILTGHFSGSDRWTNYRNLASHFGSNNKLKKLFFESDKFYLGLPTQIKKTHSGERTNFIDYVFTFSTIIGILFGSTEKTSGTNEGNTKTYVTEITGQSTGGDVVLSDSLGNEFTIPSAVFSTTPYYRYKLVKMVESGSGIYATEYAYFEVSATSGGTYTQTKRIIGGSLLQLDIGANITTVGATNSTGVVKKFRDGYVD